jgi:Predicted soluble lytic transglycosylase fused to an ABC-type amino acid-binding protein
MQIRRSEYRAIKLTAADENLEDEDLLEMVGAGLLPFAVVDDHVAQIWAKIFKSITVRPDIVINDKGTIAAALRKNSPLFKSVLNRFLKERTVTDGFATWLRQSILHQGENGPAGLRARGYGAFQRACWLL